MLVHRLHVRALLVLTCSFQPFTEGAEFLGRKKVHPPRVRQDLQSSLVEWMFTHHGFNFSEVSEAIGMTYATLPKMQNGRVDSASLRYLAHSFFMKERNWLVFGLDPLHGKTFEHGELSSESESLPMLIEELLQPRLSQEGYSKSEAVAFVAMRGDVILRKDVQQLEKACAASQLKNDTSFRAVQVSSVLEKCGSTPLVQSLSSDSLQNFAFARASAVNPFKETTYSFGDVTEMMEIANQQYSNVRNLQCQELKEGLMELDSSGTGRVPLGRFFGKGAIGEWSLTESPEYLRQLGVLDESAVSLGPQVIIANYVAAPPHCEKISGYHSNCCVHECAKLQAEVHANFASHTADPMQLASVISQMSSTTIQAPRDLSPALVGALRGAAEVHGGKVLLHGRLFAQWMHYAFPYECPYVYVSQRVKPLARSYLGQKGGNASEASKHEMMKHIQGQRSDATAADEFYMSQWTNEEEMRTGARLDSTEQPNSTRGLLSWMKPVIAVCPACCIVVWIWRFVVRLSEPHGKGKSVSPI